MPFVLFNVAIFLFTDARPTAYNKDGNLVFMQGTLGYVVDYADNPEEFKGPIDLSFVE